MDAEKAKALGEEEKKLWDSTYRAIEAELARSRSDFHSDRKLARELTSQIVNATRDEDKAALASDEAVAHGLSKLRKNKTQDLERLLEAPYFARVITKEDDGRNVEFRLSSASFPEQKIIDWRKAPISKLYYDYREGEDFAENIQGREREGIIQLRRSYQGVGDQLKVIETSEGSIYWHDDKWNYDETSLSLSRKSGHDGHLPPILSLITPDQFRLITRDPELPMVIQGIAGSGKTTVALHRLAWLLHEDNSPIRAGKTLVVMLNRTLKNYVETTLPELNIEGVPIRTYHQWAHQILVEVMGPLPRTDEKLGADVDLFKSSAPCLTLLEAYVAQNPTGPTLIIDDFFRFLKFLIAPAQESKLPANIGGKIRHQVEKQFIDANDPTLFLHLIHHRKGCFPVQSDNALVELEHIVIDECQDFGVAEIKALLLALKPGFTVTLVGDKGQKIVMNRGFHTWADFLKNTGFKNLTPLELNVSYRTTEEIMQVALYLRQDKIEVVTKRHGPSPRLFLSDGPESLPHFVGQWIDERLREGSHSLSAIICRWPKDAQRLVESLRKLGYASVRLGYRDQFSFAPGVVVTNVNQVKGLEFRNVLVVEPTENNYRPLNEEETNLLYVAVTRAEVILDFLVSGTITPLLPDIEAEKEEKPEREISPLDLWDNSGQR